MILSAFANVSSVMTVNGQESVIIYHNDKPICAPYAGCLSSPTTESVVTEG